MAAATPVVAARVVGPVTAIAGLTVNSTAREPVAPSVSVATTVKLYVFATTVLQL